jgi:hypothetical protein
MARSRVKLTFNQGAIKKAAMKAAEQWATNMTTALNALLPEYTGRPVDEVKDAVAAVWRRESGGSDLPEPHLTAYAEQIAAGGRVVVKAQEK